MAMNYDRNPRVLPQITPYWKLTHAYSNVYRCDYTETSNGLITLTGLEITKEINFPVGVRLVGLSITALDPTTYAVSTGGSNLSLRIYRKQGTIQNAQFHQDELFKIEANCQNEITKKFGEGFEFEPSKLTIVINGNNTYLLSIKFYIQIQGV